VIAIGGIDHTNLPQVMQAGAYGVAMIRAVLAASDPYQATQQLREALAAASQV
jgi:thiamine monophosphate synthase